VQETLVSLIWGYHWWQQPQKARAHECLSARMRALAFLRARNWAAEH
jgi:hypothetical protein